MFLTTKKKCSLCDMIEVLASAMVVIILQQSCPSVSGRELVPGPRWIPRSADVQVLYRRCISMDFASIHKFNQLWTKLQRETVSVPNQQNVHLKLTPDYVSIISPKREKTWKRMQALEPDCLVSNLSSAVFCVTLGKLLNFLVP